MDKKRRGSLVEMSPVAEYSPSIAGVFNFQCWSPLLKLLLQSNERVRAESSFAPCLFHFWRVVDEVYLRIRAFQQEVVPASALPEFLFAVRQHSAFQRLELSHVQHN